MPLARAQEDGVDDEIVLGTERQVSWTLTSVNFAGLGCQQHAKICKRPDAHKLIAEVRGKPSRIHIKTHVAQSRYSVAVVTNDIFTREDCRIALSPCTCLHGKPLLPASALRSPQKIDAR